MIFLFLVVGLGAIFGGFYGIGLALCLWLVLLLAIYAMEN